MSVVVTKSCFLNRNNLPSRNDELIEPHRLDSIPGPTDLFVRAARYAPEDRDHFAPLSTTPASTMTPGAVAGAGCFVNHAARFDDM